MIPCRFAAFCLPNYHQPTETTSLMSQEQMRLCLKDVLVLEGVCVCARVDTSIICLVCMFMHLFCESVYLCLHASKDGH